MNKSQEPTKKVSNNANDRPPLALGPRIPVNPPIVGYHGEVIVAADPESENNLIVCGFRSNARTGSAYEGYIYHSGDAGRTWGEVLVDATSQWVSEESCAFGPQHQAYFVTGVSDTSGGMPQHEYGTMRLYRSADGGATWRNVLVTSFMDWTAMAADATQGPNRNTLYIFANGIGGGARGLLMSGNPYLGVFREEPRLRFSVSPGNFGGEADGRAFPGKYPEGAFVLPDGSVLAVFSGVKNLRRGNQQNRVYSARVGISRDGGKTLHEEIVAESRSPMAVTGAAVDELSGEVYLCWTQQNESGSKVRLFAAISEDSGRTWSNWPVRVPPGMELDIREGSVSIAVSKSGMLGFLWYGWKAGRVYFAGSFDKGRSIASVLPLTRGFESAAMASASADSRRLLITPPVWNSSTGSLGPLRILALGPRPLGIPIGTSLVTDRDGIFHAVWSEVNNGPADLWTRTIAPHAARVTEMTPHGLSDVSASMASHISNVRFDQLDHLVGFDLTLTNKSDATILSPLIVVVSSKPENLTAANADNEVTGIGALWEVPISFSGLGCEQSTSPRTVTFRMDQPALGGHDEVRDVLLKIYARVEVKAARQN